MNMSFPDGFAHFPGWLDPTRQGALVETVRSLARQAPFFTPHMPRTGRPMSVRMTSCGRFGWFASRAGYEYVARHPDTGLPFPDIPDDMMSIWTEATRGEAPPDSCLINFYDDKAKMGLHADLDEEDRAAPIVSVSLGDAALFRLGGPKRSDPSRSFRLCSGDLIVMAGPARDLHHGVDRIYPGSSTLLKKGGRINITLRRVKPVSP